MMYLKGIALKEMPPEDSYLSKLPVIKQLSALEKLSFEAPVTFLVGENGTGKSTLLEAIAVALGFNAEGGSRNLNFSTKDSHSELYNYIYTLKAFIPDDGFFLRAESLYNLASKIDSLDEEHWFLPPLIDSYGGVSLHKQSHGESFLSLIQNRFGGKALYILDEPEAALSPTRLLTLISEIDRLVKNDSQLIIATHSPILMSYPNAEIVELGFDEIKKVAYKDTEHYRITKTFIENPERMLKHLLD